MKREEITPKKVLLLLSNGFEALEAAVFTDVFGWNQEHGDISTELVTAGMRRTLKCTWNFTVIPELQIDQVVSEEFDALAIPGGFESAGFYEDAYSESFLDLIREFDNRGKNIASICVGSLPIGKSGVLKKRAGTSYHLDDGTRHRQLASFGVNVINEPIVTDRNIVTSSSPSTALEVAFKLLEALTSEENCKKVKAHMGF